MALTLTEKTQLCAVAADSKKAEGIVVLDVHPFSSVADHFLICSGAYAGNEVEKRTHKTAHYEVVVRLDNGETRVITEPANPGLAVGEKVKIVDGRIVRNG